MKLEIVMSLLFRVEEACVHSGGRIKFLADDCKEIQRLEREGYIANYHPLPDGYGHDHCTHVVFLTEEGWLESSRLRRQLAKMASDYYYSVQRETAMQIDKMIASNK